MHKSGLPACPTAIFACLAFAAHGASIKGTVTDPSGAPVAGAQVSLVDRLGVEAQTVSAANGAFELKSPENAPPDAKLVIAAPGFRTAELLGGDAAQTAAVKLDLAPVVDSVRVVGSAIDAAASEQGGTVNLISNDEIRRRNEPYAADLLRYPAGLPDQPVGRAGRGDEPVPARRQFQFQPGRNRRRAGELVRRILRFRAPAGGGAGPRGGDQRAAIGGVRVVRQQRRHRLRDAAGGRRAVARRAGGGRQRVRAPFRHHRIGNAGRLGRGGLGGTERRRGSGGQQRLSQRIPAAQRGTAVRAPEPAPQRAFRLERRGRAGAVRERPAARFRPAST